ETSESSQLYKPQASEPASAQFPSLPLGFLSPVFSSSARQPTNSDPMSSADEDPNENENAQNAKKRRVQRACDVCRRKKIRCDGGQMPGNRCSNCIAYNFECTYVEAAKKRGPPKGYVESLELRLEKMEALLQRLCPDADFSQELGVQLDRDSWPRDGRPIDRPPGITANCGSNLTSSRMSSPGPNAGGSGEATPGNDELESSDDEYVQTKLLQERMRELSINPLQNRFFGKSSGVRLVQTALDLKSEYSGKEPQDAHADMSRRPEFWTLHPWERVELHSDTGKYTYPSHELILDLVNLYFKHINVLLPLLHRPTFDAALADGLHHRDEGFGGVLLLVCACGARYSNDERVLLEGTQSYHSAGWKWFSQVQMVRKALLTAPCLYDLQMYSLAVLYLQGCSAPQACWTMVGIGIRVAQDVGAHRRKVYNATITVEDELWKRAFCFDIDFPTECDDEYWTHPDPKQAFKQPSGKETYMSYFICFLKLNQILAFALRTIYSINKSKILLGFVGQQWEQHTVAELDSALNKWIDSVPDHLRWDPTREHDVFFLQSASLYCTYYHLQILIHRPFIPSPRKPSPLSFPSLAICTNAARSCSHVIDIQRRRTPGVYGSLIFVQLPVFTAAVVLLLSIWGVKRSGVSIDPVKEMEDVHKCMRVLKDAETRFHGSGRLWDVLYELASVGDLPLPQPSPAASVKRERDSDSISNNSSPAAAVPSPTTPQSQDAPRNIAGSRRVSTQTASRSNSLSMRQSSSSTTQQPVVPSQPIHTSPLATNPYSYTSHPMSSDELGRMPIYPNIPQAPASMDPSMDSLTNMWYMHSGHGPEAASGSTSRYGRADDLAGMFPVDQLVGEAIFTQGLDMPLGGPYMMGGGQQANGYGYPGMSSGQSGHMQPSHPGRSTYGMVQDPQGSARTVPSQQSAAPWAAAPTGFELDDWDAYLATISGMQQHMPGAPPGH
ncbi:hypothetical protein EWM64_g8827, partial [Hericium alpestre]